MNAQIGIIPIRFPKQVFIVKLSTTKYESTDQDVSNPVHIKIL